MPDIMTLKKFIVPLACIASGIIAGLVFEKVILERLKIIARKTVWEGDEIILAALKGFFLSFFVILGLYFALKYHVETPRYLDILEKVFTVGIILLVTSIIGRISAGLIQMYSQRATNGFFSTSIFGNLTWALILIMGGLMILQYLNISIAPILTALGVGGIAVALALQDTLSNLFAGIHIIAAKQIKPGDYIKLSSGEEGFVMDITWRYSNIRALSNNITIISNAEMAKARVTNFDLLEKEMAVLVQIGVSYDSDLEKVEAVTSEVAKEVMKELEGGVTEFDPFIRFHTFGDSSIDFTVILRGREFADQYLIKHEFIKRLHRRYSEEGIQIPFPIRTIHMDSGKLS